MLLPHTASASTSRADSPVTASDLDTADSTAETSCFAVVLQEAQSSDDTEAAPAVVPAAATFAVVPSGAALAAAAAVGEPCLLATATPSGECAPPSAADGADTEAATPATEPEVAAAAAGCAECQNSAVSADGLPEPVDALSVASSSSRMGSPQLAGEGEHAAAALVVSPLQVEDCLQQQPCPGGSFADIGTPCLHADGSMTTSSQLDSITVGYGGCSGSAPACFLLEPQVSALAACSVDAGTSRLWDAEQAANPTSTSSRSQQQLPASLPRLPLLEGSASWGPMCSPGAAPTPQRMYSPFSSPAAQGETDELAATAAFQSESISTPPAAPGLSSQLGAGSCTLVAGSAGSFDPGEGRSLVANGGFHAQADAQEHAQASTCWCSLCVCLCTCLLGFPSLMPTIQPFAYCSTYNGVPALRRHLVRTASSEACSQELQQQHRR